MQWGVWWSACIGFCCAQQCLYGVPCLSSVPFFSLSNLCAAEDPIRLKMLAGYNAIMYGLGWLFLRQQFVLGRQIMPNRVWMGCHVLVSINMVTWCGEVGWYCPSGKSRTLFAQSLVLAAIFGPYLCVGLVGNAWRQQMAKKMPKPKYYLRPVSQDKLSV